MKNKIIKKIFQVEKIPYLESSVNILILILIWWFLIGYFKPELMLSDKTTTGGDMVGYYYMSHYIHEYLLPHGKLMGWAPGWFAGFPMFQFYFPLPFILSGLLAYIIPLYISFKLITILGIFLLPIATFFSLRLMNFKFPIPAIGAIFTLPYLFLEHYSMWGGNIPSTLAGEFSYMLSISLMVLFFGLLWKGISEKKYFVENGILLSLIILSHGITTVFSVTASLFFLLKKSRKEFLENFKYLLKTYLFAFLLAGFYFFPMLVKSEFSTPHYWLLIEPISEIINNMVFPKQMYFFYALAIFGIYIGLKNNERRIHFFTFSLLVAYFYFFISTPLATSNLPFISSLLSHFMVVKFLPYIYLLLFLISIIGFYPITEKLKGKFLIPFIVFLAVGIYVSTTVSYIPSWIKWNYSGFEEKPLWKNFQNINEFLNTKAVSGRVEFEYEDKVHNSGLGSSRAIEALPAFSRPTLIGTQFQGGINNPSIYSMECEYSKESCPCPLYLLTDGCLLFNLENAKKHLKLFNVKYLIATTDEFKQILRKDSEFSLVYGPDKLELYELLNHEGKYVVVPEYEPVLIKTKEWRKLSYEWFKNLDTIDIPVIFSKEISEEDKKNFKYIIENFDGDFSKIPKIKIQDKCFVEEIVLNEEVKIKTSCVAKPLWIKISYFPNWQVEGAKKVYMASPTFMLIFPEKENVRLYYGRTLVDWFGTLCSYIGILILIIYFFVPPLRNRILNWNWK